MITDFIVVFTTVSGPESAEELASAFVQNRLAACVQIEGPIKSIYRWKGSVEVDTEWKIGIKTLARHFDELSSELKAIHPYETPEIIALPIVAGSAEYLNWMSDELSKGG